MRSGVVQRWAEGEPSGGKRERVELRVVGEDGRVGGTGFARRSRFERRPVLLLRSCGLRFRGLADVDATRLSRPDRQRGGAAVRYRVGASARRRCGAARLAHDGRRRVTGNAVSHRRGGASESAWTKTRVFSGFRRRYPAIVPSTQNATRGFLERVRREAENARRFVHDPFNKGFSDARRGRWQAARKLAERLPSLLAPASAVSTSFCALRSSAMQLRGGSRGCRRRCSRVESSLGHQQRRGHVEGVVAGGNATA